jgi:SAM-dependent methyltransferase
MYLRERLRHIKPGRFVEIGPGSGEITQLLLDLGWVGQSYYLEAVTIERLQIRFANEIKQGQYRPVNVDYLSQLQQPESANLVISCMVMEHLDDTSESSFMRQSSEVLKCDGLMIGFVPGSPAHWGIEDDIAGHCRRYTRDKIQSLMANTGWTIGHLAGLTFPVSNFLVNRSEKSKLSLTTIERTKHSGRRNVKFKTHFPSLLGMILNRRVLWPLHLLQKLFKNSDRALVIYFESRPNSRMETI